MLLNTFLWKTVTLEYELAFLLLKENWIVRPHKTYVKILHYI